MPTEATTSLHLRGATELTLIAPIKPGFVPFSQTLTYATRLKHTLDTLFGLRKLGTERETGGTTAGALENLRMLRFVHWSIIDGDRLEGSRLLLAVSFD